MTKLTSDSPSANAGPTPPALCAPNVQRKMQLRRKPRNRRPKYYWVDSRNLRREIAHFWRDAGVRVERTDPILIPSETLLMHYQRHDIRAAIASNGGRKEIAQTLNCAVRIMPGRWSDAMNESLPELLQLIDLDKTLSYEKPPFASFKPTRDGSLWMHQSNRRPKGYWSMQTIVQHLYEYTDQCRRDLGRPAVWMPRPSELAANGYGDLKQAMVRFGGSNRIERLAGMVTHRDWYYFEGQLELLLLLKGYIDEYGDRNYEKFPIVSAIQNHGYEKLYALIQYYGGRKFLAARLGMSYSTKESKHKTQDLHADMCWGPFDLDFGIRLLEYIRNDHMHRSPPMKNPALSMPSNGKLLSSGAEGELLDKSIQEFGGYENVARRLGLAFFESTS
jgi:hypothetical protein